MTEWSLTLNDTKTGAFVAAFQPSESSWSTSLSGSGESTETIVVNDADNPWEPGQFTNLFQPHNRMIVRWWGDTPIYAHKIDEYQYDLDKGTVTVSAQDLYTETNWRMIGGVDADKHLSLEIVGRNVSGAVRQILARMMQWGPEWAYPIDLPADGAGDITAAWSFWQGYTINEILAEITRRTNAEIFLRVYRTTGRDVRFQTLLGNPITLDAITLNMAAERLPISAITYTSHGVTQITGLLGIGNGSGEDQESRWAGGGPFSIPIRDTKKSFRDLGGEGLQQATSSTLTTNLGPVRQWDVAAFTIDDDYGPDLALPGRVLNIETHEDPIIPTAVHALRVVRASGDNANQLKIEVQNA